jgi:hypothetical protein
VPTILESIRLKNIAARACQTGTKSRVERCLPRLPFWVMATAESA